MQEAAGMKGVLLCIALCVCLAHGDVMLGDVLPRARPQLAMARLRGGRPHDLSFIGMPRQDSKRGGARATVPEDSQWSRGQHVVSLVLRKTLGVALVIALIGPNLSSKEKTENDKKDKKARKKEDQPFKLDLMKILPRFHFEFRQDGTFPDITRNEKQESAEREAHARDEEIRQKISRLNQALVNDLRPGDHIRTKGAFGFSSMSHHAIYIGDDRIVHFTGGSDSDVSLQAKQRASIKKEHIKVILSLANQNGVQLEIVPRPSNALNRDVIVQRALSRVGDKGYNLLLSNCEHFAQWCVTGVTRSDQVLSALQGPIRFLRRVIDDLIETSQHPIKGKPLRHSATTVYTVLSILSAHLIFFSW